MKTNNIVRLISFAARDEGKKRGISNTNGPPNFLHIKINACDKKARNEKRFFSWSLEKTHFV